MRSSFERRGTSKRAVVIAVLLALLVGGSAQAFEARRETEVGAYIDGARIFPGGPARMDSQIAHVDPTSMAKMQVVQGPYALTWGAGNLTAIRVETPEFLSSDGTSASLGAGFDSNRNAADVSGTLSGRSGAIAYWAHGAFRSYDHPADRWYLQGLVRGRAEQDRVATIKDEIPTDGYAIGDIRGGVRLLRNLRLDAGVENFWNQQYVNHLNQKNPFTCQQIPKPGIIVFVNVAVFTH